jgi:hypothetical protein
MARVPGVPADEPGAPRLDNGPPVGSTFSRTPARLRVDDRSRLDRRPAPLTNLEHAWRSISVESALLGAADVTNPASAGHKVTDVPDDRTAAAGVTPAGCELSGLTWR